MGIDTLQVLIPFAGQFFKVVSAIEQKQCSVLQQVDIVSVLIFPALKPKYIPLETDHYRHIPDEQSIAVQPHLKSSLLHFHINLTHYRSVVNIILSLPMNRWNFPDLLPERMDEKTARKADC